MLLTTLNNIDDVFDNFFKTEPFIRRYTTEGSHNIEHDDDGATLTMNIPGYNKKLIDVSVDGAHLVVEGKANSGDTGGFTRRFNLNDSFDVDGIEASVVDGVLTVSIPYTEAVKPRQIEVKVK